MYASKGSKQENNMKKSMRLLGTLTLFTALGTVFVSCSSTPKKTETSVKIETSNIDEVVIIDWTDRTIGEVAAPQWLKNMRRGNSNSFKEQWNIDGNRVVKISMATGKTEATAQALSRAGFAYTQAAELNQKVIGRVGQGLNDIGQLEALYIAASETKAEMTGLREETGFYQKVRTIKAGTKEQTESFIYYTVFSMDKNTWDNLCKKYLLDVMDNSNLETDTQKRIGALYSEIKEDADKKEAKKQAEEEALYKLQLARLEKERAEAIVKEEESSKKDQTKSASKEAENLADFLL